MADHVIITFENDFTNIEMKNSKYWFSNSYIPPELVHNLLENILGDLGLQTEMINKKTPEGQW